jgi:hypothetical protein
MFRPSWTVFAAAMMLMEGAVNGAPQSGQATTAATSISDVRTALNRYCVTCHNEKLKTGGLILDTLDPARVGDHAEIWEKVVSKLRAQVMPPIGLPRPDRAGYLHLTTWLEDQLDRAAAANLNPGRPSAVHRFNRNEYRNAIRDLLALDVDVDELLPADTSSYGFDNIGDVLRVSPVLMERYLAAARKITQLAIGDPTLPARSETYVVRSDITQSDRLEGLPFGTRGGTVIRYDFPLDGEYEIKVRLGRDFDSNLLGLMEPQKVEVLVDGERVKLFTVGGGIEAKSDSRNVPPPRDLESGPIRKDQPAFAQLHADDSLGIRFPVKAGEHTVGVTFIKHSAAEFEEPLKPWNRGIVEQGQTRGEPYVSKVIIGGPYNAHGASQTASRSRILICHPDGDAAAEQLACAKKILSTLARRAYRRPVTPSDLDMLLGFYQEARANGGFEKGIEQALARMLMSPSFLFRVELDPATAKAGTTYRITDLELAPRLSFFLWSSIPDDELLDLAIRGQLKEPATLDHQVRRMLADPRSDQLVKNFTGQWLYLRNLQDVKPDHFLFPEFDDNLRQAFRKETELFFGSVLNENRSALDLLSANYSFVNERLARHYGIPYVYGDQFRRVTFADGTRGGLLGQGSILTVRSYANRTSPVLRGVWILENLLGITVPPPPPNVPPLKDTNSEGRVLSMRERMVQHRANAVCASCHSIMDPLGLPLENYDAIGQWRTVTEANTPLDASGSLPDGTKFDGVAGLKKVLLDHSDLFVSTLTGKLMTYGLGRGLEFYDAPTIRGIVRDAEKDNYRISTLIEGIVKSVPFQMRRSLEQQPAVTAARKLAASAAFGQ